jgi:uncharacterized membrane protein
LLSATVPRIELHLKQIAMLVDPSVEIDRSLLELLELVEMVAHSRTRRAERERVDRIESDLWRAARRRGGCRRRVVDIHGHHDGLLIVYCGTNLRLGAGAWDPYPFILLNLILSMLAAV